MIILFSLACRKQTAETAQASKMSLEKDPYDTTITFENETPGQIAFGWSSPKEDGSFGKWRVIQDGNNKVLGQISNKSRRYNVAVMDHARFHNLEMTVRIKAISGDEDQGGGLIWRYQDVDNYYIARFNPLEDNFRVYRVVKGDREELASDDVKLPAGEWFEVAVKMKGNEISCSLNGTQRLYVKDDTFSNDGKIGLWSKSDAASYFDDLRIIQ